jgi:hypothetical protein
LHKIRILLKRIRHGKACWSMLQNASAKAGVVNKKKMKEIEEKMVRVFTS